MLPCGLETGRPVRCMARAKHGGHGGTSAQEVS